MKQHKCYYAVQGHSRSPISVPIERLCDFLLVINSTGLCISCRFEVIADCCLNFGHSAF